MGQLNSSAKFSEGEAFPPWCCRAGVFLLLEPCQLLAADCDRGSDRVTAMTRAPSTWAVGSEL